MQRALIYLLKGIIYYDNNPEIWNELINNQYEIRGYFSQIGLDLFIDEAEGYAFLRQQNLEDGEIEIPQLIIKRQLSYPVSLLCVLMRKQLLENDANNGDIRPILSLEQIVEMMAVYLPLRSNEHKTREQVESYINKLIDLGFLRRLKDDSKRYEIKRIIKAMVDSEWLSNINTKLEEYAQHANAN